MNGNYLKSTRGLIDKGGLDYCTSSNIDDNFHKYFPSLSAKDLFKLSVTYPNGFSKNLVEIIKQQFNLKNVVLGAGCEDLILRICQITKDKHWKSGVVTPTFYRITDNIDSPTIILNEHFDKGNYKDLDIVWLVNPNPLIGKYIQKQVVVSVVKKNPQTLFVIDETAVFFLDNWEEVSLLKSCRVYSNLIVITSFSKFYALSGLRVGFAVSSEKILNELGSRGLTFPISDLTAYLAEKVVTKVSLNQIREAIVKHKKLVESILLKIPGIEVRQSDTNCVFCRYKDGGLYERLLELGIIGLNLDSQIGVKKEGWVRLTIHSSQNKHKKLIRQLAKLSTKNETKN